MDRASASGAEGHRFESCNARYSDIFEMDICEFLVDQGVLAPPQAQEVKTRSHRERLSLLRVILDMQLEEEGSLYEILADASPFPAVDLPSEEVDPDTLRVLPHELAATHLLMPLSFEEADPEEEAPPRLRVAVADSFMELEEISSAIGYTLKPSLARASSLETAIGKHYSTVITKVMSVQPSAQDQLSTGAAPKGAPMASPHDLATRELALEPRKNTPQRGPSPVQKRGFPAPAEVQTEPTQEGFIDPPTIPSHNVEDEVSPNIKIQAVVNLLCREGVLDRSDYIKELRRLLEEDRDL